MSFISSEFLRADFDLKIAIIAAMAEDGKLQNALLEGGKLIETACKEFCPVDTGRLRSSILAEAVSEREVDVAPHTDYAAYVEFGTYKMDAQPYMSPGFEQSRDAALDRIRDKLATP
jgi:HK97 gp10 family phage protein